MFVASKGYIRKTSIAGKLILNMNLLAEFRQSDLNELIKLCVE